MELSLSSSTPMSIQIHPFMTKPIESGAKDVFLQILSYFTLQELGQLSLINKEWYVAASENRIWKPLVSSALFPLKLRNLESWKKAYMQNQIRKFNWEKGLFKTTVEGRNHFATHCQYHEQKLSHLQMLIFYKTGETVNQIDIWNRQEDRKIYTFYIKEGKKETAECLIPLQTILNESCCSLKIKITGRNGICLKRRLHLTHYPSHARLDTDEAALKVNYLFFYIKELIRNNFYIHQLFTLCSKYQNTTARHEKEMWMVHQGKLQIYDIFSKELIQEIDIPDFTEVHLDMALFSNQILILNKKKIKSYCIEKQGKSYQVVKKWEKATNDLKDKMIIVPEDEANHFALFNSYNQTLEFFDLATGQNLCCFNDFEGDLISLDANSFRFLNKENKIVVYWFTEWIKNKKDCN